MTSRTDNNRRLDFLIDDPPVALAPERGERTIIEHTHVRPAEQKIVEFASPDRVADDARVRRFNGGLTDHPRSEPGDLLKDETGRVVFAGLEIEGAKHAGRHPAAAHLVARESGSIEHDDVPSCESKRTRTARASGATTDDERVTASHSWKPASAFA